MNRRPSLYDRVLDRLARSSPGPIAGGIDLLRPTLAQGFGGPFNGQERRIEAVREIFERVRFRAVLETGTYRATTTVFLRHISDAPIATIEADPRYYHYARFRLLRRRVSVVRGDSSSALRWLASRDPWNRNPAFFYLDAHWLEALPLQGELATITEQWRDFVIVIDDFRVPGDPGYGYDDYGPGRVLDATILASLSGRDVAVYWPAAPSAVETGARRGWVVIASEGEVDDALKSARWIRRAGDVATVVGAMRSTIA